MQLNLSVPGARSLGLGGAFLALADDATAAYANPAGVALLPGHELTVEARAWEFEHRYSRKGRREGALLGGFDDTPFVLRDSRTNGANDLSFLSYSYGGSGWGLAGYYHKLAAFEADLHTEGLFLGDNGRLFPTRIRHRFEIDNLGVSFARSIDRLGVAYGVGVAFYRFHMNSLAERFSLAGLVDPPPAFERSNLHDEQIQRGNSSDLALLLGALYWIHPEWRLGGSFRGGGSFDLEVESREGPLFIGTPSSGPKPAVFRTPSVVGVGVLYAPLRRIGDSAPPEGEAKRYGDPKRWKIALDVSYIEYSVFADGIVDIFELGNRAELESYDVDDGIEVHLGTEVLLGGPKRSVFLRGGFWYDPRHALEFNGREPAFREVFRPGEGIEHYTLGLGTTGYRYQVDLAFDYSKRVRTGSLSFVYRFDR